jgi:hypothetical protein
MRKRWYYSIGVLAFCLISGVVSANPLNGAGSLTEEKVTEILYLEANQLVKGFAAQFPKTLAAMPDNPLNNKMDALRTLLNDEAFQIVMVGVALETLKAADVETIIKAKAQGVIDEKYISEMVQISWNFADRVTPLIIEALIEAPQASAPVPS